MERYVGRSCVLNCFILFQVLTALLVAGSTLTFCTPGLICLHPPTRTQASFKAPGCSYNCKPLTCDSFQLTHMLRDDHAVQLIEFEWAMAAKTNTLLLCSQPCHRGKFRHVSISQDSDHYDLDRIVVGLSWELHCWWQLDRALERWQTTGRKKGSNSTTKFLHNYSTSQ